jgi:uncharacterized protein (DUF2132 family)
MGHYRLGWLRKTQAWREIVELMGQYGIDSKDITALAFRTLKQVEKRYERLENDPSVKTSFDFLLKLAHAFRQKDPERYLKENRLIKQGELTPISLAKAAKEYETKNVVSEEYETFAKQALVDSINQWYLANIERGRSLFSEGIDSVAIMRKAAEPAGFCEITRLFFANYTERYLKYFLEREASTVINNVEIRKSFSNEIDKHIDEISKHAFQTAYITQSYAAAWYTKYAKDKTPAEGNINVFLSKSFNKMKAELLLEEGK